jgi:hypothetical protein
MVVALDQAVRRAYPKFDVAIKYRSLMYALRGDFRNHRCAGCQNLRLGGGRAV